MQTLRYLDRGTYSARHVGAVLRGKELTRRAPFRL